MENCLNCKFCGRLLRSNSAAEQIEHIKCRRFPVEEEMRPDDWCGEWCSNDPDTKTRAECPL